MKHKITKSFVEKRIPNSKDEFIWDTETKGFGLKVSPRGKKVFIFQSRIAGFKKPTRITIGEYGDKVQHKGSVKTLTVVVAREISEIHRGKMQSGIDPRKQHEPENLVPLVSDLLDVFIERHVQHQKLRTRKVNISYINKVIKPYFKGNKIDEVSKGHVSKLQDMNIQQPCRANHIFAVFNE